MKEVTLELRIGLKDNRSNSYKDLFNIKQSLNYYSDVSFYQIKGLLLASCELAEEIIVDAKEI